MSNLQPFQKSLYSKCQIPTYTAVRTSHRFAHMTKDC